MTTATAPVCRHMVKKEADSIVIHIPMTFKKRSGRRHIVLPDGVPTSPTVEDDARCPLKVALARAFRWQKMIESGEVTSNCDLARKLHLDQSYVARTIHLASLAPDIVDAILKGDEPSGLSLKSMREDIPLDWDKQRKAFQFN